MKLNNFKKKVILITGSSGDIGIELCKKYLNLNYVVIAQYYTNSVQLEKYKAEKNLADDILYLYKANFFEKQEIIEMFTFIENEFGHLDVLVNNAGVVSKQICDLEDSNSSDLVSILNLNIVAQFECGKLACKLMKNQNQGVIVNISSLASKLPNFKNGFYSVSKSGLEMLTKSMALEWAKYNIQVNSVLPGAVDSSMARKLYDTNQKMSKRVKGIPLKKLVSINSIVNTVVFLSSGDNDDITGSSIVLDGGASLAYFKILSEI
jgi:3-oxoacyl-[acyl-carrier protein] reductase